MTDLTSLYPDDQPKAHSFPSSAPLTRPARQPDATEAVLYPNDQPKTDAPQRQAQRLSATDGDEPATLTYGDKASFDATQATSFFDQHAIAAMQEGDQERSAELGQAGKALVRDFKSAGADASVLNEALRAYNETAGEYLSEDQRMDLAETTMAQLQAELGPNLESDLALARQLIEWLDQQVPGLKASLEGSGAGNDPRIIKAAIREAKRRYLR